MRAVMKGGDLGVPSQALISGLELLTPLLVQSAHRLAQIPVCLRGIEVQGVGGVVSQHPGEDRVLIQVVEGASR